MGLVCSEFSVDCACAAERVNRAKSRHAVRQRAKLRFVSNHHLTIWFNPFLTLTVEHQCSGSRTAWKPLKLEGAPDLNRGEKGVLQ